MMRPVILSRPEKLAFLLTIFWAGGSVTTSSPGCRVAGVRGGGSEKMLPIWADAGGASASAAAASSAANPPMAIVFNISRLHPTNQARDILYSIGRSRGPSVNMLNAAGKGRLQGNATSD